MSATVGKCRKIIVKIKKTKTMTRQDCSLTTMGLKEDFIYASLKLYINRCQAYNLTSPFFATMPRMTVKLSARLQRHPVWGFDIF